jgi:hypothetical protein
MRKFILLAILAIPDGHGSFEPFVPPSWESYERQAYGWDKTPLNKPSPSVYWEMSAWTRSWLRRRQAVKDALRMTVPQYYITPFVTRELTE